MEVGFISEHNLVGVQFLFVDRLACFTCEIMTFLLVAITKSLKCLDIVECESEVFAQNPMG